MQGLIETAFGGESLTLHHDRGVWWAKERTLFIADTHFGKAASFRHAGIPVPETVTGADTDRIDALVRGFDAHRLIILGDFFHAPSGRIAETEGRLGSWRAANARVHITLVRGNHDRNSGDPPRSWGIECVDPGARCGPFGLTHTPEEASGLGTPTLCGHVHPGVVMRERSGPSARLACFFFHKHTLVVPAFGRFTGLGILRPRRDDRVFVIAEKEVHHVSPPAPTQRVSRSARAGYDEPMISEAQPG